jgi:hypothetical protein
MRFWFLCRVELLKFQPGKVSLHQCIICCYSVFRNQATLTNFCTGSLLPLRVYNLTARKDMAHLAVSLRSRWPGYRDIPLSHPRMEHPVDYRDWLGFSKTTRHQRRPATANTAAVFWADWKSVRGSWVRLKGWVAFQFNQISSHCFDFSLWKRFRRSEFNNNKF